ncbi:MAG: ion channel [Terriglobales bacterium]|jgi:hypothetical protein
MNCKWLRSGFLSQYRIEIIMWVLVVEMLASPLADTHPRAGVLLGLAVLCIVVSGIRYMAGRGIVRSIVLPLAGIWMVTRIGEAFGNRRELYANLSPFVGLIFSCSVLWAIFDHFHSRSHNPRSAIAEAFIGYLVIATAYSQVYWILNRFVDRAFNQAIPTTQNGTLLYFSMVTLTSVGYGGIVPIDPYVRMLLWWPAIDSGGENRALRNTSTPFRAKKSGLPATALPPGPNLFHALKSRRP